MSGILSLTTRGITLSILGVMMVGGSGCAPSSPVVTDTIEPWQEELARERQEAQSVESSFPQASVARQMYDTGKDGDDEKEGRSPFVVAVTDIIGFPFRGAGWIARQLF